MNDVALCGRTLFPPNLSPDEGSAPAGSVLPTAGCGEGGFGGGFDERKRNGEDAGLEVELRKDRPRRNIRDGSMVRGVSGVFGWNLA